MTWIAIPIATLARNVRQHSREARARVCLSQSQMRSWSASSSASFFASSRCCLPSGGEAAAPHDREAVGGGLADGGLDAQFLRHLR